MFLPKARDNLDLNKAFDGLLLLDEPVAEAWGVDHREPGSVPRVAHPVPGFQFIQSQIQIPGMGLKSECNTYPTSAQVSFVTTSFVAATCRKVLDIRIECVYFTQTKSQCIDNDNPKHCQRHNGPRN